MTPLAGMRGELTLAAILASLPIRIWVWRFAQTALSAGAASQSGSQSR